MEKAPQSPSPVADTSTAPNGNAQKRDDAVVLEKLAQFELLPDLFALLQRVATGDIKGQDFDNHAGPIRLKLNTIRLYLQEIDGICETVDQRQKKIEVLKDCNARQASFLRDFKSRVLADLREDQALD